MGADDRDPGADVLLDLDGQVLVIDPKGEYLVRFTVQRVEPSSERPHGLKYSLGHYTVQAAGASSALIMHMQSAGLPARVAGRKARPITATVWALSGRIDLQMRRACSRISGGKWTGS